MQSEKKQPPSDSSQGLFKKPDKILKPSKKQLELEAENQEFETLNEQPSGVDNSALTLRERDPSLYAYVHDPLTNRHLINRYKRK